MVDPYNQNFNKPAQQVSPARDLSAHNFASIGNMDAPSIQHRVCTGKTKSLLSAGVMKCLNIYAAHA